MLSSVPDFLCVCRGHGSSAWKHYVTFIKHKQRQHDGIYHDNILQHPFQTQLSRLEKLQEIDEHESAHSDEAISMKHDEEQKIYHHHSNHSHDAVNSSSFPITASDTSIVPAPLTPPRAPRHHHSQPRVVQQRPVSAPKASSCNNETLSDCNNCNNYQRRMSMPFNHHVFHHSPDASSSSSSCFHAVPASCASSSSSSSSCSCSCSSSSDDAALHYPAIDIYTSRRYSNPSWRGLQALAHNEKHELNHDCDAVHSDVTNEKAFDPPNIKLNDEETVEIDPCEIEGVDTKSYLDMSCLKGNGPHHDIGLMNANQPAQEETLHVDVPATSLHSVVSIAEPRAVSCSFGGKSLVVDECDLEQLHAHPNLSIAKLNLMDDVDYTITPCCSPTNQQHII